VRRTPGGVGLFVCIVSMAAMACLLLAGEIDSPAPPGAPGATFKTLNQIEPRTHISSIPFTIDSSGSYYLAANLTLSAAGNGITVDADNVVIDLNGFTLAGGGGALTGIFCPGAVQNVLIRNGTVRGWTTGIDVSACRAGTISGLRVLANSADGVRAGSGFRVCEIIAEGNGGVGIAVQGDSLVEQNRSLSNGGTALSVSGEGSRIKDNLLRDSATGLAVSGSGNHVSANTVNGNGPNYNFAAGNHLNLLLSELPETISWPARVTLVGSLTGVMNTDGLTLNTGNVTVDMNGHALVSGGGAAGNGINVPSLQTNIVVMNGTVQGWGDNGVRAFNARGSRFVGITASGNQGDGLQVGAECVVRDCTAKGNTADGIDISTAALVVHSHASGNGSDGFEASNGSTIQACTARNNGRNGFNIFDGASIIGCSSERNDLHGIAASDGSLVADCVAANNSSNGVYTQLGTLVRDCVVRYNDGAGLRAQNDCKLVGNTADNNLQSGVFIQGSDCRVDGNHCTDNSRYAIESLSSGNLFIRNSAAGNQVGPFQFGGSDAGPVGSAATATSPFANLSF
jgi:parallel beta-helix repeat protein